MEGKAISRFIKQSPRKVRQVVELVRDKGIEDAINLLHFCNKRASIVVEKTIRSAVSNLRNSEGGSSIEPENMYIKSIYVNEGPTARRYRATSRGRASIRRRRTSHLSVIVAEKGG